MTTNLSLSPMKVFSIAWWKVSLVFINPKKILAYMNVPQGVVKVVFSLSSGKKEIWLYPQKPSIMEILDAPVTLYNMCSIFGSR